jgi:hypothetical protein
MADKSISKKYHPNQIGDRFGKLTLIESPKSTHKNNRKIWLCRCECGNETTVIENNLRRGIVNSCGCLRFTATRKHGQHNKSIYIVWAAMKQRCLNPKDCNFHKYGARGIKVCDRWLAFENFFADMGERPSNEHSLDRIDNNGHYEPDNVRWATREEQQRNKRDNHQITINGQTKCITAWAEHLGIRRSLIFGRISSGWCETCAVIRPMYDVCPHRNGRPRRRYRKLASVLYS